MPLAFLFAVSSALNAADVVRATDKFELKSSLPSVPTLKVGKLDYKIEDMLNLPAWHTELMTSWNIGGTFRGVLLKDLLADAAIADFSRLSLSANDGHKISLSQDHPGLDTALVAYALDGKLLDPIDKGPYWVLWPEDSEKLKVGRATGDLWIWGLINIRRAR